MLHLLRAAAKTWVFRGLFALLIISFAVWGVGDLTFGGSGARVAQVGDKRINVQDYATALSREINAISRRAGRPILVDEAVALGVPDSLLARIVRDAALDEEAARLGLSATDLRVRDALLDSPSFQGLGGTFDQEQYRFILQQLGFTVERFEADLRRSLARDRVAAGIAGGVTGTPGLAEAIIAQEFETRSFDTVRLPLAAAEDPGAPSEGELIAWHEAQSARYEAPERRMSVWLEIDPEALTAEVDVPEADARSEYEARIDRYDLPERRAVERIVFADDAEAQAAKARIEAGEASFAEIGAERGLAPEDMDQGEAVRADLGEGAEAVFSAGLGVAGPAPTAFGPALYNVSAVLPARTTPFEDARAEIEAELALEIAEALAAERVEEAADLLASGATLEEIAADAALPLRAGPVTRAEGGGLGLAAAPEFIAEAFEARPGEERDVVQAGRGFVLVRVDEIVEAAVRPLSEVRAQAMLDWAEAQRREAVLALAETAASRLAAGEEAAAVALDLGGTAGETGPLRQAEAGAELPAEAVPSLYRAEAEGAVASGATPEGAVAARLSAIAPADLVEGMAARALEGVRQAVDGGVAQDLYAYYGAAVQERMAPTVNTLNLEQAINALRGGHGGGY
ncbi:MAG: SurA N-terminal domain-containing protein [Pseudomonadota bacterium]